VVEKDGPLHFIRQPPPEARTGLGRRLRAFIGRTHVPAQPVAAGAE
jgi:hypothetical protein